MPPRRAQEQQQAPLSQRQACIHFLSGSCRFGSRCRYAHDTTASRPQCTFFQRGHCSRGDACMYAHGEADQRPVAPFAPTATASAAGAGRGAGAARVRQPAAQPAQPTRRRQQQQLTAPAASRRDLNVFRDPTESELEEEYGPLDFYSSDEGSEPGSDAGEEEMRAWEARQAEREQRAEQRELEWEAKQAQRQPLPPYLVTEEFKHLCWCKPCRRGFKDPQSLRSHLQSKHPGSERIAQLEAERECPCGHKLYSLQGLSSHISKVHNRMTPGARQGQAMLDVLLARAAAGQYNDMFGGGDDYSSDEGGMCGFTGDEVEELLCQGVKPWEEDAWEVMAALYDY